MRQDVEHLNAGTSLKLPFSEAVQVGNTLYLSGQVGLDSSGKIVPGGIAAETKQTLENIRAVLERYGSSMERVVKCTVMLADIGEWGEMNKVYVTFFGDKFPARSALGVNGLALMARVEIECIAVTDSDDELTLPGGTLYENFFWGISRHEVIAGAAHRLLLPNARREVERILGDLGASDLSEVAGWADRVKYRGPRPGDDQETVDFLSEQRNLTNDRWHYVDIPFDASSYQAAQEFTREDDVVQILSEAIRVLLGSSDRFSEANALRLVTHLTGDVHQPLHVGCSYVDTTGQTPRLVSDPAEILANGYGDDQGGNAIWLPVGTRGTSLHTYWDSRLGGTINLFSPEPPADSAAGFAADVDAAEAQRFRRGFVNRLVRMFPGGKATSFASPAAFNAAPADGLPVLWANETLGLAPSAYESLEVTGQHTDDQGKVKYDVSFGAGGRTAYDQRCKPLVRQQMQLAAQNLGALLNKIWP